MATKVTQQSFFSRLGNSIKGIFFGIILFFGSFVLLWWNEGNAVRQYQRLNEVALATVEISADEVPQLDSGQLVHVSGRTATAEVLEDPAFGLSVRDSIHLQRRVEMYQWEERSQSETRTRVGGGQETVTTYSYHTTWSGRVIDSSRFYEQDPNRRNPGSMPFSDRSVSASNVQLGALQLHPSIISQIGGHQIFSPSADELTLPPNGQLQGEYLFIGANPASPQVGDVRIQFRRVPAGEVSILAGLQGNELNQSWADSRGSAYSRVQTGLVSKEAMIAQAEQEVKILTWILRFVGWLVMSSGLGMFLSPLRVMSDILPFFGRIVGAGLGLISGLISAVLSLVTIAIAWVAVRPMIGIPLLVVAAVLLFVVFKKTRKAPVVAPAAA
jgi:hypothetical protein